MLAVVHAQAKQHWPARIAAVISNRSDAPGLEAAKKLGISTAVVESCQFFNREAFDQALQREIDGHCPDLVVLAGFMRILTPTFVEHFAGRLLNIHPSLLPSFPGLATHRQALAAGVKLHGTTVHFVTAELDHGPIVAQSAVPVLANDTEESLAQRVLIQEHILFPRAIEWFIYDQMTLENGLVRITPEVAPERAQAPQG